MHAVRDSFTEKSEECTVVDEHPVPPLTFNLAPPLFRPSSSPGPFVSPVIGLTHWSTIPMLVVDACTNVYLTVGFVWPVWRSAFPAARRLARISCIAAVASLVTSLYV